MKTKKPTVGKRTIGLDLGDRRHHACVLDDTGNILAEEVIVNTREVLTAFCARYPGATVVMETGTHSPWVSLLLAAQGHPVIVGNARKLRAISQSQTSVNWTQADAAALAVLSPTQFEIFSRTDPPGGGPGRWSTLVSNETIRALQAYAQTSRVPGH